MNDITIALVSGIVGIVATLITLQRESKKQITSDAAYHTSVREEVKYISKGIDDIRFDTRSMMTNMISMNERLVRTEESVKSAHEKIDNHIMKGEL